MEKMIQRMKGLILKLTIATFLASILTGVVSAAPAVEDPATVAKNFYVTAGANEYAQASQYVDPTSQLHLYVVLLRQDSWRQSVQRDVTTVQFTTVALENGEATVRASGPMMLKLADGQQIQAWMYTEAKLVQKGGHWYVALASGF